MKAIGPSRLRFAKPTNCLDDVLTKKRNDGAVSQLVIPLDLNTPCRDWNSGFIYTRR
jgi:hypothetical protein